MGCVQYWHRTIGLKDNVCDPIAPPWFSLIERCFELALLGKVRFHDPLHKVGEAYLVDAYLIAAAEEDRTPIAQAMQNSLMDPPK